MRHRANIAAAALVFLASLSLSAQQGNVQNAASNPVSSYAVLGSSRLGSSVVVSFASFELSFPANSPNIVSPRMLAVLTYPTVVNPFLSVSPAAQPPITLALRPAGSAATIPITVTNSVAGSVTFVVPAGVPLGGAELIYKIGDQPTQWTNVTVVQSSLALFRNSYGGPAIAQIQTADSSLTSVGLTTPAKPGQTLYLTGSGLGYGSTVTATIGGIAAPVTYAGPHPTRGGIDQFLIQIPAGVADGCYVPVDITYNLTWVVTTSIAETSDGSPCKHPWQLSLADMKTLDNGGVLDVGEILLASSLNVIGPSLASRTDDGNFTVGFETADAIANNFAPDALPSGATCGAPVQIPTAIAIFGNFSATLPPSPLPPDPDLGSQITLRSPDVSVTLQGNNYSGGPATAWYSTGYLAAADGSPTNPPHTLISAGELTWQSSGGKDLPASTVDFTLPRPIQMTGTAPLTFTRTQDQTIAWNKLDSGTVFLNLAGRAGTIAVCSAPASAGQITIPAKLLAGVTAGSLGTLTLSLNPTYSSLPHATLRLANGNTLLLFVSGGTSDNRPVLFQ